MLRFDPSTDWKLLLAVLAIPLAGFVVNVFIGRRLPGKGAWLLTGGMFVVMAITVWMAAKAIATGFAGEEFFHQSREDGFAWSWLYQTAKSAGSSMNLTAGILYDNLGAAHAYKVTQQIQATPNQVEYILPTGREQITMVSCYGTSVIVDGSVVDMSHRLITIAAPI